MKFTYKPVILVIVTDISTLSRMKILTLKSEHTIIKIESNPKINWVIISNYTPKATITNCRRGHKNWILCIRKNRPGSNKVVTTLCPENIAGQLCGSADFFVKLRMVTRAYDWVDVVRI